jgi:PmbA protein
MGLSSAERSLVSKGDEGSMQNGDFLSLAQDVLALARSRGADEAEVRVSSGNNVKVTVRRGDVEKMIHNGTKSLSVRVFLGNRTGAASTCDIRRGALEQCVCDAIDLAGIGDPDPTAGLPEAVLAPHDADALDMYDPALEHLTPDQAIDLARRVEAAAFAYDSRITNSDDSAAGYGTNIKALVNSRGFAGAYRSGGTWLQLEAIADDTEGKKRNAWWSASNRRIGKLEAPESVGREAAKRAVQQLGARKAATSMVPVVWDPQVGAAFLGMIFAAANGYNVYQRTSFLLDREGEQIAAPGLTIIDDATIPGLMGSRPFDGEGVPTRRTSIVEDGVFKTFLYDSYSARRAGLQSTGNASAGGGVMCSNLYMQPGEHTPEQIIASIDNGLYLTGLLGRGENLTTGDFSRGARGVWIENGQLAYPVGEINISGKFQDMLQGIDMIGDDLVWRSNLAAPTFRMRQLVVSGT